MRIANIYKYNVVKRNLQTPSVDKNKISLDLPYKTNKTSTNNLSSNAFPAFCGIVCFDDLKKQKQYLIESGFYLVDEPDIVSKSSDIIEEHMPLVMKAEYARDFVPVILNRYKDAYDYAADTISEVKRFDTFARASVLRQKSGTVLEEVDAEGKLRRKTVFDRYNVPKIIKDYANNSVILFDDVKNKKDLSDDWDLKQLKENKKITVLFDCKDIDNESIIMAQESFSFVSGTLSRYTTACRANIDSSDFISDEAFNFNRNVFKSYDDTLTVSSGAEYSKGYYEFKINPRYHYSYSSNNTIPAKYIENKVSVNGKIYYSTNEVSLSEYFL